MAIFCFVCKVFFKRIEMGHEVIGTDKKGNPETEQRGDLYECPSCHVRVITDFGFQTNNPERVKFIMEKSNPNKLHVEVKNG
jgi:hypothetical protein